MRSPAEVARVQRLRGIGLNASEIARTTGIPRGTVMDWLAGRTPGWQVAAGHRTASPRSVAPSPEQLPGREYSYLFGLYLGDGCLSEYKPGVFRIRIALDSRYPRIIAAAVAAIRTVMPHNRTNVRRHPVHNVVEVYCYSKHWPALFPQHGPGRKHERDIILEPWQGRLLENHIPDLLRGLIHSDGCRVVNRVMNRKYAYPRYMFSNRSDQIRAIFTGACEEIGVHWTTANRYNVAVSRRADVALLDTFIGPKA
jgi:hypothetical protein